MGYDDLKVIEAARFLQSVADGEQRPPGVAEIDRRGEGDRRHRAIVRVGAWEAVAGGAADPRASRHLTWAGDSRPGFGVTVRSRIQSGARR